MLAWAAIQDVERVERTLGEFDDTEQARRIGLGVLAPERLYDEREELRQSLARAAFTGGADFGGMTMEEVAREADAIDAMVRARRPVS